MPVKKKPKNYNQGPIPEISLKGFEEIMNNGMGDQGQVIMSPGGYLRRNYAADAIPTASIPTMLVQDRENSGGVTSVQAAAFNQTEQGQQQLLESRMAMKGLMEMAAMPESYNTSSKGQSLVKMIPDAVAAASETVMDLWNSALNLLPNSKEWMVDEANWDNTVQNAYGKDPTLKEKMPNLVYQYDNGTVRPMRDMTYEDLAYSRVDRWVNLDGTPLDDTQKVLMEQYKQLNSARVSSQTRAKYSTYFGEQMKDLFGLHQENEGDYDLFSYKLARGAGDVAASGLVFGYGGMALEKYIASFGAAGVATMRNRAHMLDYIRNAKKMNLKRGMTDFAARRKAVQTYRRLSNVGVPAYTVLSGIRGDVAVFSLSFARQYEDIRNQALLNGWSFQDANWLGTMAGFTESSLELVKFNKFTKRFLSEDPTFLNLIFGEVIPEAGQEMAQTAGENFWTQNTGLTDKQFKEIASEVVMAGAFGALGGLAFGGIHYNSITSMNAEKSIKDKYRKGKEALSKLKELPNPWVDVVNEAPEKIRKIALDGMSGERGFVIIPGSSTQTTTDAAIRDYQMSKMKLRDMNSDIKAQEQQENVQEAEVVGELPYERFTTLGDNKGTWDRNLPTYIEDGRTSDGNRKLITGNLVYEPTGEVFGVYGIIVDNLGKQVGTYERAYKQPNNVIEDASAAQDMANLDNEVLDKQKVLFEKRAKSINPDITPKQLENGWKQVKRAAMHEQRTGDFSKAVELAVSRMMDIIDTSSDRVKTNIQNLQNLLGPIPMDIQEKMFSDDYNERYEAEWTLVENSLIKEFKMNGLGEKQGKLLAQLFRNTFEDMLLIDSDLTPSQFYDYVKPKVVSYTRAELNGQHVPGMHTIVESIAQQSKKLEYNAGKDLAYRLLRNIDTYKNGRDKDKAKQAELEIYQAVFGRKNPNWNVDDIDMYLGDRADIEETLAYDMGFDILYKEATGDDLDGYDFRAIALMRLMGYDQAQINKAFGVEMAGDPNATYDYNLKLSYAPLTTEELNNLASIVRKANRAETKMSTPEADMTIQGAYDPSTRTIAVFDSNQKAYAGKSVTMHEGLHWIFDVVDSLGSDVFDPASLYDLVKSQSSEEVRFQPVQPLQSAYNLKRAIRNAILNRQGSRANISDEQIKETMVDAFFNWVMNANNVPVDIARGFTEVLNGLNGTYNGSPMSIYGDRGFSQHRKDKLGGIFGEMFKPGEGARLMRIANKLNNVLEKETDKKKMGKAMLDALNDAKFVPFESTTGPTVEDWMNRPEEEVSVLDMRDLGNRIKENIRNHAVYLAGNQELKGEPSSFDSDVEREWDLDFEERVPKTLFTAKGTPAIQHARQGKPSKILAKETLDVLFNKDRYTKAAKQIGESIAHAARALKPEMAALISRLAYENTLREFHATKLRYRISELFDNHKKLAEAGKATAITEAQYEDFKDYVNNYRLKDARKWMQDHFTASAEETAEAVGLFDEYLTSIEQAKKKMNELGVKFAEIKQYWPREVDKQEDLIQYLRHAAPETIIGRKVRVMEQEGLSNVEIINRINQMFRRNPGESEVEMFHKRIIPTLDRVALRFYKDPFEAASDYLESASRTIMMREMFGDIQYEELTNSIGSISVKAKKANFNTGKIGSMLLAINEGKFGKYDPKAMDNFVVRMKQLQKKERSSDEDFFDTMRALQGVFALGTFKSTINQFLELGPALYRYGVPDVALAVNRLLSNKNMVDISKIGIRPLNEFQRLDTKGYFPILQDKILRATGFQKADVFMKNLVLEAALIRSQRVLAKWDMSDPEVKAWEKRFETAFPSTLFNEAKRNQIKQDLQKGNITKDVGLFLRNELSQTQALDVTEVSANYASAGSLGKAMWYLSTTQMKQAEFFLEDWANAYKEGGKAQLAKQMAKFAIAAAIVGLPVEIIAALCALRKPDLGQAFVYSPLQYFFVNKYMMANARRNGIFSAAFGQMAPSIKIGDEAYKDLLDVWEGKKYKAHVSKSTPIAGSAAFNALNSDDFKNSQDFFGF